ncbi:phage terminase large subunit [Schlesneria sp. T3-172]|uniref:phage terminase large subunit n=1 Tax=Schlesneria sphaerica TaxID=3373610 RepID=UPI0037C78AFB
MSSATDQYEVSYLEPHPGPQTAFLASEADICFYGGQAGGGKTWALLVEAARYTHIPTFGSVIFRRTSPQITNEGALWDESVSIYSQLGARPIVASLRWIFPSGAKVAFRHLQYEADAMAWQGSQVAMLGFDEVTHFTQRQFFYLMSRGRTKSGVDPYIRATCNPVPDDDPIGGWVRRLLDWWIDPVSGLAIPERSGVIRYFIQRGGEIIWGDSKQELVDRYGRPDLPINHDDQTAQPKSLTFIPAKLADNPSMPGSYKANLLNLEDVEKQRLADGNWNAKRQAGMFFKIGQIQMIDALPIGLTFCRAWDLAATDGDGDWTVGAKIGRDDDGFFYIADVVRGQWEASYRDKMICQTTGLDGRHKCKVRVPQDPAAAGKAEAARMTRMLSGFDVRADVVSGDKQKRATGFAAQVNAGNVRALRGPWLPGLLSRLDAFPTDGAPDDEIDALADAFNELTLKKQVWIPQN